MKDVVILVGLEKEVRNKLKQYVATLQTNRSISAYVGELIKKDLTEKGIIK